MDVAVRPAVAADGPAVAHLEGEARAAVAEQRGGPELLAGCPTLDATGWQDRFAADGWRTLVGTIDDVVVGFAAVRRAGTTATISHLYVTPEAREVGIGEAIVEDLLAWAPSAGAIALEATALPGDRETKNLFERVGMKARAITVSRRLG